MKKYILILLVLICYIAEAQNRDNIWEIGYHFGPDLNKSGYVDFSTGSPVSDTLLYRPMTFFVTNTGICDTKGNLLFYTNGQYIANRKNDSLQHCYNFNPGTENLEYANSGQPDHQASLIVPDPGDSMRYYLFSTSGDNLYSRGFYQDLPLNMRYSIIDMRMDSGYGGIDSSHKTVIVLRDSIARGYINACKHGNGRDWWIVFHQFYFNRFYKLLLTPEGIAKIDSQNIGSVIPNDILGESNFSPDGSRYAFVRINGSMDIFDFDRCSGNFYNRIHISVPIDTPYQWYHGPDGCTFSASGRYLYVNDESHLYQYDLQSSDIDSSRMLVAQYLIDPTYDPDSVDFFWYMQRGPDDKIYIGTWGGSPYFHVINAPDSAGIACDFKEYQIYLPDYNVASPTYPDYDLGAEIGSGCDTLTSVRTPSQGIDFNIFPNPATQWLNINFQTEQNLECIVFDETGRIVSQFILYPWFKSRMYDVGRLPQGMYIVEVKNNKGNVAMRKFVKE